MPALQASPLPIRYFLPYAATMSSRFLRYNRSLLLLSRPPHCKYAAFQIVVRVMGLNFVSALSRLLGRFPLRRWF